MFSSCALVLANRMIRRVAAEISFIFLLAAALACFVFISWIKKRLATPGAQTVPIAIAFFAGSSRVDQLVATLEYRFNFKVFFSFNKPCIRAGIHYPHRSSNFRFHQKSGHRESRPRAGQLCGRNEENQTTRTARWSWPRRLTQNRSRRRRSTKKTGFKKGEDSK